MMDQQQLWREMERANGLIAAYPDTGDSLDKALWQVRYWLAREAGVKPFPDFGHARDLLLLESMLLEATAEREAR